MAGWIPEFDMDDEVDMAGNSLQNIEIKEETIAPRVSEWQRFRRVFFSRGLVIFGMVIILITILVAILAPVLAVYDPYELGTGKILEGPSQAHWLGTDQLGRDTLSRLIYGARVSLMVGLIVVILAAVIGMTLGLIAGYYGAWPNNIIMRCIDALMSFPMLLLAMVIAALLGGGITNVIIALTVGLVPIYCRVMCAQVLAIKENDYIAAGKAIGASDRRIMLRHVVINSFPPFIVIMTMMLGSTILAEAGLSFLGIGIEAPTAAWGSMVNDGRDYLTRAPLLSFVPGGAIMLVVFSFNMVGDGLRDALDPRLRGAL
ncbi:MAG: ABC transporter permease [Dehalococcoidales bacterium]|nr:ABC transporter permease [Dehalococcoidales bacterium]